MIKDNSSSNDMMLHKTLTINLADVFLIIANNAWNSFVCLHLKLKFASCIKILSIFQFN